MRNGFSAPPARQASECLAGQWGPPGTVGLDGPARDNAISAPKLGPSDAGRFDDLPLTAFFRSRAGGIERLTIAVALAAAAAFILPLLVR
jgi:hypothetical protein